MEFTHNALYGLIVCLCGIATCTANANTDENIVIVSDFSPPALYFATFGQRLNFKQIPVDGGRRNITAPAAVDFDPVERRVYWTQWSGKWTNEGNICRCDLKGNFYQVLVKQLDYANGLAIDVKARKMYFSHEGMALERANLDGTGRVTVVRELATSAFFVFLDPVGQRIYWADSTKKVLESSKLNGRNRTVHLTYQGGTNSHPSDVFVDPKGRRIYYANFGTDRIMSSTLRGEDIKVHYQYPLVSTETHPNSIAVTEDEIYWVDRGYPKLKKIPKNIRQGQVVTPTEVGNLEFGWPSGLHIYQSGGSNLKSSSIVLYFALPVVFQLLLKL